MRRLLKTRIRVPFPFLSFFPVVAGAGIYLLAPTLASLWYSPNPLDMGASMGMEIIIGLGIGLLFLCFSLLPSVIITIAGLVYTIALIRKGENSITYIIFTLIAAIPLLYILQSYVFDVSVSNFIPATTAYPPY